MTTPLTLRSSLALLALGLAASACANRHSETPEHSATSQPPTEVITPAPDEPEAVDEELVALSRGMHASDMSEAVMDARAEAALTLDLDGGVRLWPDIRSMEAQTPVVLPVQEPSWMSLAKAEDGSFLVAFVDTAGAGRVARVEVEVEPTGARFRTLFETPATEPLFELHALDGGQRVLSLRVDHRVELFDMGGKVVSAIDQASFVPWQLRVSPRPGQAPAIMAILAGPTRVQPVSLRDDRLALDGDARTVVIDRGPNRNDLSLSPDGTTIAALRKPRSRKSRVTIELVDLATDQRRLLAVETDDRALPRLHWVDDGHLLLESGTGHGFRVDLSKAIPWTGETGRDETDGVAAMAVEEVALPYSEGSLRSHASVIAGIRLVPTSDALVLDPLDEDVHRKIGGEPVRPRSVALDADGGRVAWSSGGKVMVEALDAAGEPRVLADADAIELAFLGEDRLVGLTRSGEAKLWSCDDGQELESRILEVEGRARAAGFVRSGDRNGRLGILGEGSKDPVFQLEVVDGSLGTAQAVPTGGRSQWPELGVSRREASEIVSTLGFTAISPGDIRALVTAGDRHYIAGGGAAPLLYALGDGEPRELVLRAGEVERLVPDPSGQRVAVVQLVRRSETFGLIERDRSLDEMAVSVVDLRSGKRLWTRASMGVDDLGWSGDGQRVAIAGRSGGRVLDAGTGEVRLDRRHLAATVEEVADPAL